MSDLHALPLTGRDLGPPRLVRANVFKRGRGWYWSYKDSVLTHGPFASQPEAFTSAFRMVELL